MNKILLVITQADFGGAQRAVFELASGLKDHYDIAVAAGETAGSAELLERCSRAGVRTIRLKYLRRAIRPISDILAVFELRGLIQKEKFDLVHAHSSKAGIITALALPFLTKARGCKFSQPQLSMRVQRASSAARKISSPSLTSLYTAHGWVFQEPQNPLRRLIYLLMEKAAGRRRTATIVLSEAEKAIALRHRLGSESTIAVIPNGVACPADALPRDAARAEIGKQIPVDLGVRWIGTVANLYRTKGIDVLVETAKIVRSRETATAFIIIGDGPERQRLRREIEARDLSGAVYLAGRLADASRLVTAFDLLVLPSRKEGLPFALLDAAAAGVPIVSTNVGGIPEVLRDGVDALLVPPDSPTDLAGAILRLLADSALAARISSSARERVCASYPLERMVRETDALYRRLLS